MGNLIKHICFKNKVDLLSNIKRKSNYLFDLESKDIDGNSVKLKQFTDNKKAIIFVNVACNCGYTNINYIQLVELFKRYSNKGLQILAFPCNQFLNQENKIEKEIKKYITDNFKVNFPVFSKIKVNGPNTDPIYVYLKSNTKEFVKHKEIKSSKINKEINANQNYLKSVYGIINIPWNFSKFLVDSKGSVVSYLSPDSPPFCMINQIEKLINCN